MYSKEKFFHFYPLKHSFFLNRNTEQKFVFEKSTRLGWHKSKMRREVHIRSWSITPAHNLQKKIRTNSHTKNTFSKYTTKLINY